MKTILVIGVGRFGKHLIKKLVDMDHQVMAVDTIERRVDDILDYAESALIGDSTDKDFMMSLGIRDFDICYVTIGDNFENSMLTTYLLKELGAKYVIARASRDRQVDLLRRAGADDVVYPEKQVASWSAIRYSSDHLFDYFELPGGYGVFEVEVLPKWIGKSIMELDIRKKYNITIIGVKHGEKLNMNILPNTILTKDMRMMVIGELTEIRKCFKI